MTNEEILDTIEKEAHDYELKYHGCSRCALRPIQEHLKLGDGWALKAATPLAAGIGMRGETCGALLGGIMAIGMVTASEDFADEAKLSEALTAAYRYWRRFVKEFGSPRCRDIQLAKVGRYYDLSDIRQYEEAREKGFYDVVSNVVGKASRMAAQMIVEQLGKK
ncbi:MAG TPA: C_GCAxxG_C_C family protein [Dehalococcoidia bacterium]|nr:C_GCAxxG_C_C family protein [Dehalococcoidia bacterium]